MDGLSSAQAALQTLRGQLRMWRNWQTHRLEGAAGKPMRVRVSLSAPKSFRIVRHTLKVPSATIRSSLNGYFSGWDSAPIIFFSTIISTAKM